MGIPLSRRQWVFDVGLALLAAAASVEQLVVPNNDGYFGGPMWLNVTVAMLRTLPLAVRRVWPVEVAVVVFGADILASLVVPHTSTFWGTVLPMAVAVYTAARWSRTRWSLLVPPLAAIAFLVYPLHMPTFGRWDDIIFPLIVMWAAFSAGYAINRLLQQRHDLKEALRQLAEQREAHSRHIVLEERTRIAREMHDVLAHGVTVMVVQAGAARMELDETATAARESLLAVEAAGRQVIGELRRTLSLLRLGDDFRPSGEPSPGLADLPDLVASMRTAGLTVDLQLPERAEVDPGRELAVYRVVQEALTNSLRHAGRTHVTVRVRVDPHLEVEISDSGPRHGRDRRSALGSGHGLIGMKERVMMYGGRLLAEPRGPGFVVHAAFPPGEGPR
ncbi:sensor histidine kinase [Nonomuraea maritima]|uniref:sensor histidine kinase n=1 Tax=Nonomuraea maritima TaxID=683260 RepID=UPI0037209678